MSSGRLRETERDPPLQSDELVEMRRRRVCTHHHVRRPQVDLRVQEAVRANRLVDRLSDTVVSGGEVAVWSEMLSFVWMQDFVACFGFYFLPLIPHPSRAYVRVLRRETRAPPSSGGETRDRTQPLPRVAARILRTLCAARGVDCHSPQKSMWNAPSRADLLHNLVHFLVGDELLLLEPRDEAILVNATHPGRVLQVTEAARVRALRASSQWRGSSETRENRSTGPSKLSFFEFSPKW
jgi:hypothetical protein